EEQVVIRRGGDVGGAVCLEHDLGRLLQAIQVQVLASVRRRVGAHGPGACLRVESITQRRQRACSEKGGVEQCGGHHHRRAQVEESHGANPTLTLPCPALRERKKRGTGTTTLLCLPPLCPDAPALTRPSGPRVLWCRPA